MSNLAIRVISSLVMAVIALSLAWVGGAAFRVVAVVIAGAVFYEWTGMMRSRVTARRRAVAAILLAAVLAVLLAGLGPAYVFGALVAAVVLSALHARMSGQGSSGQGSETSVALAYAGLSGISLALLRDGDAAGLTALLFLFAVVWATDIFAYFAGRAIGGPKLAPAISPGKTWSGAIGGAAGGVVAGLVVAAVAGHAGFGLAMTALVLSVVAQVGDLFESSVKRRHGAKDSSNLIPGHGGVMDRVDGLVAAAFALYLICVLSGGADQPAHGLF
jgi:phosphatidate cytidylyltransferase